MKLSVSQLRRVIKEELSRMLREEEAPETAEIDPAEVDPEGVEQLALNAIQQNPDLAAALANLDAEALFGQLEKLSKMKPEVLQSKLNKQSSKLSEEKVGYELAAAFVPPGGILLLKGILDLLNSMDVQKATELLTPGGGYVAKSAMTILQQNSNIQQAIVMGLIGLGLGGINHLIVKAQEKQGPRTRSESLRRRKPSVFAR